MGPLEVLSSSLYAVCIYAFAWDLHTYRDVFTSHSFTMHVANRPNADYGSLPCNSSCPLMFTDICKRVQNVSSKFSDRLRIV